MRQIRSRLDACNRRVTSTQDCESIPLKEIDFSEHMLYERLQRGLLFAHRSCVKKQKQKEELIEV